MYKYCRNPAPRVYLIFNFPHNLQVFCWTNLNFLVCSPMHPLKPQKLKKRDVIGIVAPASPVADPSRIDLGVSYLERLGYNVVVGPNVLKKHGYLAGTDEERAADLHAMFRDRSVRMILCARGGYGTPRLLRLLDYALIKRNPKILVGFSDITALQLAFWAKCGLVTFHAPMLATDMAEPMDPFTEEMFWLMVTSSQKVGNVGFPEPMETTVVRPGAFTGHLLGGNLSLLVSLLGTPFQPSLDNAALFLEEVGEEPYRVDRMLAHLQNASALRKCRGVLIGRLTDCIPQDPSRPSLSLDEVLKEFALALKKPVISDVPFGHVKQKITLPLGVKARVNVERRTLELLEAAVV
jgi:muramoyltetrapeptide carboxypeptidase